MTIEVEVHTRPTVSVPSANKQGLRGPEGRGISEITIDEDGSLVITMTDDEEIDLGLGLQGYVDSSVGARDQAQKWAAEAVNTVVSGGLYSARHYAAKAAESATAADTSKSQAAASSALAGDWAEKATGQDVSGVGTRSAKHWAFTALDAAEAAGDASDTATTAAGTASSAASLAVAARNAAEDYAEAAATFDPANFYTKAEINGYLGGKANSDHTHGAATTSAGGFMSATDKQKLDGVAAGAQVNAVSSVAGKTGAVTLDKGDVGLGNVANTAPDDLPVSSATQTALNGKQSRSEKGEPNGYAGLGEDGKVPTAQLPAAADGTLVLIEAKVITAQIAAVDFLSRLDEFDDFLLLISPMKISSSSSQPILEFSVNGGVGFNAVSVSSLMMHTSGSNVSGTSLSQSQLTPTSATEYVGEIRLHRDGGKMVALHDGQYGNTRVAGSIVATHISLPVNALRLRWSNMNIAAGSTFLLYGMPKP